MRLVAPITITPGMLSRPSMSANNVATMLQWTWSFFWDLSGAKPSSSSKNITEGRHRVALSKSSLNFLSDSPTHLSSISAPFLWKKVTFPLPSLFTSVASAPATNVLPVPEKIPNPIKEIDKRKRFRKVFTRWTEKQHATRCLYMKMLEEIPVE